VNVVSILSQLCALYVLLLNCFLTLLTSKTTGTMCCVDGVAVLKLNYSKFRMYLLNYPVFHKYDILTFKTAEATYCDWYMYVHISIII